MAGGIVINGRFVARPGIYSNINYINLPGAPTQGTVLAVVGDFPFLEQNVPYVSTSQRDFEALAPQSKLLKQMSGIIYNPLADANLTAAPAQVYLLSPRGNEQANATLPTSTGTQAPNVIDIKAKQWGVMGNKTTLRVTVNQARGGWDALVANNGTQENIRVPSEAPPLTLRYINPTAVPSPVTYPVKGFGTWGASTCTVDLSAGVAAAGTVRLAFTRNIAVAAGIDTVNNAWMPEGPVSGPITVVGSGITVGGGAGAKVIVTVTGVDEATGLAVSDLLEFTSADISTAQTTDISFSSVTFVRVTLDGGATITGGNFVITGQCFDDMNEAAGQKYVSDVIKLISAYANKGFLATTESSRVTSIKLSDLDKQSAVDIVAAARSLTVEGWKLVTTINNASKLIELTRGNTGNLSSIVAGTPFFTRLAGGSEDSLLEAADWGSALDQLVWYNIDVVTAFYDPTGTPAADDAVLAQFSDHITRMWADGANERTLWLGAGHDESLDVLVQRAAAFNSERVNVVVDSAYIQQPDGSTELMRPYWYALLLAAADASLANVETLTRARPRVLGTERAEGLNSQEDVNELIRAGLIISTTPPGGATRVEREVTTWTADENPARTEAICTRSVRASTKAMRAALDALIQPGSGVLVLADVRSTVTAELERQARSVSPLITSYDDRSISIVETADRYEIGYTITVRINKNFITLNVGVTVPVGTI
jgi:hypothetical protein